MPDLPRDVQYALVLLREGLVAVAVIWTLAAVIRARSVGVPTAIVTSLAEATLAAGLVAVWALTVAPLKIVPPGESVPPAPVTLIPVLPLVRGLLAVDGGWELVAAAANIALYVPLGVGLAWRFGLTWRRVVPVALVVSGAVETWQAVGGQQRSGDVNDVLLNACGALLGASLVATAAAMSGRRRSRRRDAA